MNTIRKIAIALTLMLLPAIAANAQVYQMVNQATNMLQTALAGGFNYRGFVEGSASFGLGNKNVEIYEITTTQGAKYADWFYIGVGAGVDILHSSGNPEDFISDSQKSMSSTGVMIPLYSDFRFSIGNTSKTSFYIDARLGASFLMGSSRLQIGNGYINRNECFYFRPSIGFRIPVSTSNPKQALNIGASYTLITTQYWCSYSQDITLNNLGVTIGFEW